MKHPEISVVTEIDFDEFFGLIEELADFENLERPDSEAKKRLFVDVCGPKNRIQAFLIRDDGNAVGYAIIFFSYSSFLAKPTLYLEDIYIQPAMRGKGIGSFTMKFLARKAVGAGCGRMEWVVLDWNTNAQEFYDALGAQHMKEWFPYRITGEALQALAQ